MSSMSSMSNLNRPQSTIDLDILVRVLSKTMFSPSFCLLLPLTLLSQVKRMDHPAFVWSAVWTGMVCLISLFNHIDRIYSSRVSWLFAPPKLTWDEQIVLITGGGSGIGALLAETLAMRNVTVVVLTKYAPSYETQTDNIHTYLCDVSKNEEVEAIARRVREEVGDPTILINNAGVVKGKLLLDLSPDDIQDTFGANTLAHFWILKAFLPAMLKTGKGHVVSVSSILGLVGAAQMTDYCASKAALISLHQTLRAELDTRYKTPDIRTTLILPSFILTSLFSHIAFPTNKFFNFLAPPVHPHDVVKNIIDALDAQESRIVRLPSYSNLARFMGPGVGIVPKWLDDTLRRISGADFSMSEYGPKPDAGERLQVGRLKEASAQDASDR